MFSLKHEINYITSVSVRTFTYLMLVNNPFDTPCPTYLANALLAVKPSSFPKTSISRLLYRLSKLHTRDHRHASIAYSIGLKLTCNLASRSSNGATSIREQLGFGVIPLVLPLFINTVERLNRVGGTRKRSADSMADAAGILGNEAEGNQTNDINPSAILDINLGANRNVISSASEYVAGAEHHDTLNSIVNALLELTMHEPVSIIAPPQIDYNDILNSNPPNVNASIESSTFEATPTLTAPQRNLNTRFLEYAAFEPPDFPVNQNISNNNAHQPNNSNSKPLLLQDLINATKLVAYLTKEPSTNTFLHTTPLYGLIEHLTHPSTPPGLRKWAVTTMRGCVKGKKQVEMEMAEMEGAEMEKKINGMGDKQVKKPEGKINVRMDIIEKSERRICARLGCGKREGDKKWGKCGECKRVVYCSKECRSVGWVLHRFWCTPKKKNADGNQRLEGVCE